jgi:hypothetical protein
VATRDEPFYGDVTGGIFGWLLDLLNRLDRAHIHYELAHTRPDSVMTDVAVPGWRWEIEFMADGSLDIERYRSVSGVENDPSLLEGLFRDAVTTRCSGSARPRIGEIRTLRGHPSVCGNDGTGAPLTVSATHRRQSSQLAGSSVFA